MRSTLAALVLLLTLPAIAAAQFEAFKPGGPVQAGVRATCDLPVSQHMRNTGGSDGLGLCVFTSIQMSADWQHVEDLDGYRKWMERRPGGGYPSKVDATLAAFAKSKGVSVPGYVQHVGGDDAFLGLALATGRMPCVTYAGRDDFYRGQIAHMVNLVYLDAERACIIDNNRPGVFVWMDRTEFLVRWRAHAGGWAVVLLAPPPPPHPVPPTEVVGQCPPGGCPLRPHGREPVGPAPGPEYVWGQIPGVGFGWIQQARPAANTNFGLVADQIEPRVRWCVNGRDVQRADAAKALTDDSGRYHLAAVGDATDLRKMAAALATVPATDRDRLLVNAYPSDHWAVTLFGLRPGVTLRRPAKARVGADAGHVAGAEMLADLVAGEFHPKPPAPPAPPPAPAPDPLPAPQPHAPEPTPAKPCRGPVVVYALLGILILLNLTNRGTSK